VVASLLHRIVLITATGIALKARARLLPASDARLGTVSYIGDIPQIAGSLGPWIGITLDEPTGKNDGSIPAKGKEGEEGYVPGARYFQCLPKCGVFVRPERVEIGDFPVADDFGEEMEEM
jgi:tubulin-folding cofactor B